MRIFVTVGAQLPFDRLVHAVDEWARARGRDDVFAQIAESESPPTHISHTPFMDPDQYLACVMGATLIVAHAGMGTILTALEHGKPLLVLPRLAKLGETRNDHQVATARVFSERGWIAAATAVEELAARLDAPADVPLPDPLSPRAPGPLLAELRSFVAGPDA